MSPIAEEVNAATQRVPKTARRKIGQAPVASDPDVSCVSLLGSIESLFHADMQIPALHALIDYSPGKHKFLSSLYAKMMLKLLNPVSLTFKKY